MLRLVRSLLSHGDMPAVLRDVVKDRGPSLKYRYTPIPKALG